MTTRTRKGSLAAGLQAAATMAVALAMGFSAVPALAQPVAAGSAAEHRLGAGGGARITVYRNLDITLETRVAEASAVSDPLVCDTRLASLSVTASEAFIVDSLRSGNSVEEPQVDVARLQVRGCRANVPGQVDRPKRYRSETADTPLTELTVPASRTAASSGLTQCDIERGIRVQRNAIDGRLTIISPAMDDRLPDGDVLCARESRF